MSSLTSEVQVIEILDTPPNKELGLDELPDIPPTEDQVTEVISSDEELERSMLIIDC